GVPPAGGAPGGLAAAAGGGGGGASGGVAAGCGVPRRAGVGTTVASPSYAGAAGAGCADGAGAPRGIASARNAEANSAAVAYRSSGFFASALRMTSSIASGSCTFSVDGGSGSSFSTFCIVVVVAAPPNGRSPVTNWYRITP